MATDFDDLLSQIPMTQLAQQLGVDEQTAEQATRQALPALLGGMQANAHDPSRRVARPGSLASTTTTFSTGVDLGPVDTVDGDKIVSNVFGDNREQVVSQPRRVRRWWRWWQQPHREAAADACPHRDVVSGQAVQPAQWRHHDGLGHRRRSGLEDLLGGLLGGQGGVAAASATCSVGFGGGRRWSTQRRQRRRRRANAVASVTSKPPVPATTRVTRGPVRSRSTPPAT